jgi:hypothetical protein
MITSPSQASFADAFTSTHVYTALKDEVVTSSAHSFSTELPRGEWNGYMLEDAVIVSNYRGKLGIELKELLQDRFGSERRHVSASRSWWPFQLPFVARRFYINSPFPMRQWHTAKTRAKWLESDIDRVSRRIKLHLKFAMAPARLAAWQAETGGDLKRKYKYASITKMRWDDESRDWVEAGPYEEAAAPVTSSASAAASSSAPAAAASASTAPQNASMAAIGQQALHMAAETVAAALAQTAAAAASAGLGSAAPAGPAAAAPVPAAPAASAGCVASAPAAPAAPVVRVAPIVDPCADTDTEDEL